MLIFDDINRENIEPASYSESHYQYLNRSGRIESERVRNILQKWFDDYPSDEKNEMLRRLQSSNDISFLSAFYELYIYELLKNFGYSVIVHPDNPSGKKTKPDFLVANTSSEKFYLEAKVISEKSEKELAAEAREKAVYDSIENIKSPNFFLGMIIKGSLPTPPPTKKLRSDLENWLAKLDPDEIERCCEKKDLPTYNFKYEGWKIEFLAIPKVAEARGKEGVRPIGMQSFGAKWYKTWDVIRAGLNKKGNKYGDIGEPLIIAINILTKHLDNIDIEEALFGKEKFIINRKNPNTDIKMTRNRNGFWINYSGPVYTRVSSVLIDREITPWSFARRKLRLYHNPWATIPYQGQLCKLSQAIPVNGVLNYRDGILPNELFNLHEAWPEEHNCSGAVPLGKKRRA